MVMTLQTERWTLIIYNIYMYIKVRPELPPPPNLPRKKSRTKGYASRYIIQLNIHQILILTKAGDSAKQKGDLRRRGTEPGGPCMPAWLGYKLQLNSHEVRMRNRKALIMLKRYFTGIVPVCVPLY